MLAELHRVDPTLLGVQLGVNDIVNETVLLEELLVIEEIVAWEDTLEEATTPVLIICVFDCLLFFLALILLKTRGIGIYYGFLIYVLDDIEANLATLAVHTCILNRFALLHESTE